VARIGGDYESAPADAEQIVLAHHPQYAFVIDVETTVLQLGRDSAVAIGRRFQGGLLQGIADFHLDRRGQPR
jgi:hypothetical protein